MSSPLSDTEDPLAGYYVDEKQPSQQPNVEEDPLSGYYVDEQGKKPYKDIVSEELRSKGYEPDFSEELERAAEQGHARAAKGLISGTTGGLSELVPGLKTEPGDPAALTGEIIGSTLPIGLLARVFNTPLIKIAEKSPVLKRGLTSLANLTGVFLGGSTYKTIQDVGKKGELPSPQEAAKHGFEWTLLDLALSAAGKTGVFAYELLKKAKTSNKVPFEIVNEINNQLRAQGVKLTPTKRTGDKALSLLENIGKESEEITKQNLKNKPLEFKATEEQLNTLDDSIPKLSNPILPEKMSTKQTIEDLNKDTLNSNINRIGKRHVDDQALGSEIQKGIKEARDYAKLQYDPLYADVSKVSKYILTNPSKTAATSGELVLALENLRTRPTGYSTVIKTLENVLKDAGYVIQRDKVTGKITKIIGESSVELDKLMELGRRLNEIVNYDVLDKSIQDRLIPVVKAVKSDIRSALKASDENVLSAFELAEEAFGANAAKSNRESIRKIRSSEAPEKVVSMVDSSTALEDLRQMLPEKTMQNIERHLLEKMNNMSEAKAKEYLRKINSGLSKQSRQVADEIILSKKPNKTTAEKMQNTANGINNELNNSLETGTRPKKTLDLWQDKRGRKFVKDTLSYHPQKAEIEKYLNDQTIQDIASTVITKEGKIDIQKLNEMMSNPAIRENILDIGGPEAVKFFYSLGRRVKGLKNNTDRLVTSKLKTSKPANKAEAKAREIEKIEKPSTGERGKKLIKEGNEKQFPEYTEVKNALDNLGLSGRFAFNVFTPLKFGIVKGLLVPIAGQMLKKLATSKKVRGALIRASEHQTDPLVFISAVEALGKELVEEE